MQVLARVFLSHRSGGGSCKAMNISKMASIFNSTTGVQKLVIRILCSSLAYKERIIQIDHFTVVGLVTRPLNGREAGVDLALIQTSLLLLGKSSCS